MVCLGLLLWSSVGWLCERGCVAVCRHVTHVLEGGAGGGGGGMPLFARHACTRAEVVCAPTAEHREHLSRHANSRAQRALCRQIRHAEEPPPTGPRAFPAPAPRLNPAKPRRRSYTRRPRPAAAALPRRPRPPHAPQQVTRPDRGLHPNMKEPVPAAVTRPQNSVKRADAVKRLSQTQSWSPFSGCRSP
jgi:hypothetical protein